MTCAFLYEAGVGRQFLRALMHPASLASKTPTTFASVYLLRDIDRANSLEKQDKWLLPEEMLSTLTDHFKLSLCLGSFSFNTVHCVGRHPSGLFAR